MENILEAISLVALLFLSLVLAPASVPYNDGLQSIISIVSIDHVPAPSQLASGFALPRRSCLCRRCCCWRWCCCARRVRVLRCHRFWS
jgi:hypothetical protein